jgi:HSP20 family molecular chaperone IbpA
MTIFFGHHTTSADPFDTLFDTMERRFITTPFLPLAVVNSINNQDQSSALTRPDIAPPKIDFTETADGYTLHADLPGLSKENVNVTLKDNLLTISGERSHSTESKDDEKKLHVIERSFGSFTRSLKLPKTADVDKVDAKMENGVLELKFGKKSLTEAGVRQIKL